LSLATTTFGPRYRWHPDRRVSLYIQGLVGDANGFAAQFGGVVDYRLSDRFAMRVLDTGWARTQLPNSSDSVQNTLRHGAGIVLRFAH